MNRGPALRVAACLLLLPAAMRAQDTVRTAPPAPSAVSRLGSRLLVVFRPPARGVRRERVLSRGDEGATALIPDMRVDSLVPQTTRATPFVAVCASGAPDSVRLTVRIIDSLGTMLSGAGGMVHLVPGLNRIAIGASGITLADGELAEWTLTTPSGAVLLTERIQRRFVRGAPTVNSLARNGAWFDALDLFVVDALQGIPLAVERLDAFLSSVGAKSCPVRPAP